MAKTTVELKVSDELKEVVREIVKEELAAHEERLKVEQAVKIKSVDLGGDRPYYGVSVKV